MTTLTKVSDETPLSLQETYKAMGRRAYAKRESRHPPMSHVQSVSMLGQWWREGYDDAVREWRAKHSPMDAQTRRVIDDTAREKQMVRPRPITEDLLDEFEAWTRTADMFLSSPEGCAFAEEMRAVIDLARTSLSDGDITKCEPVPRLRPKKARPKTGA